MKKQDSKTGLSLMLLCLILTAAGCGYDNDIVIPQTSIDPVSLTEVTVGDEIRLTGKNMHLITHVTFGETEAEVNLNLGERDRNELVVRVPALELTGKVDVTATYNTMQKIVVCRDLHVTVPPVIPTVTTQLSGEVMAKEIIELSGTHLNIIRQILVNGEEVPVRSIDVTNLTFLAPEVEVETEATVKLIYDNSLGKDQELAVGGSIRILPLPVARVYTWTDVVIGGQATGLSFFDGTTGIVSSPCDLFGHQAEIDFMMNVSNAGENQFYDPSNTTNVLKNQWCDGLALGAEDGKDYSLFHAVSTRFRILSESNAAQMELITKVREGDIEEITDELFEGISAPSSRTPKDFVAGNVVWYYNEYKDKNGLIEIVEVVAGVTPQENTIRMNVYFEK